MSLNLTATTKLLFIGDSITDVGWRTDKDLIGNGYVRMVRDYLSAKDPKNAPIVLNRGISGNKVTDLQKRWQRDVIDLQPDVLSVYIGINDVWHGFAPDRTGCPIDQYVPVYREILSQVKSSLPSCRIVLCEPSVIWLNDPHDADDRLIPYAQAVHQLAGEFGAQCVVRLRDAFAEARKQRDDIAWTTDGVHPTSTGHALIARTWLDATGLL